MTSREFFFTWSWKMIQKQVKNFKVKIQYYLCNFLNPRELWPCWKPYNIIDIALGIYCRHLFIIRHLHFKRLFCLIKTKYFVITKLPVLWQGVPESFGLGSFSLHSAQRESTCPLVSLTSSAAQHPDNSTGLGISLQTESLGYRY